VWEREEKTGQGRRGVGAAEKGGEIVFIKRMGGSGDGGYSTRGGICTPGPRKENNIHQLSENRKGGGG